MPLGDCTVLVWRRGTVRTGHVNGGTPYPMLSCDGWGRLRGETRSKPWVSLWSRTRIEVAYSSEYDRIVAGGGPRSPASQRRDYIYRKRRGPDRWARYAIGSACGCHQFVQKLIRWLLRLRRHAPGPGYILCASLL